MNTVNTVNLNIQFWSYIVFCLLWGLGRYAILDAASLFLRLQNMQMKYANDLCYDWLISVYCTIHQAGPRCWILNRCGCANVWFNELVVFSILWIYILVIIFCKWSILTGLKICVVNVNSFFNDMNLEIVNWHIDALFSSILVLFVMPGDFPVHPYLAWLLYHQNRGISLVLIFCLTINYKSFDENLTLLPYLWSHCYQPECIVVMSFDCNLHLWLAALRSPLSFRWGWRSCYLPRSRPAGDGPLAVGTPTPQRFAHF